MQLRTKITGIFILLTGLFQIVIFVLIYFFSQEYTENEFYLRLSQRATIAAKAYLEKDEVTIEIYEDIRIRHLQTLPDEKEVIYPVDAQNKIILVPFKDDLPKSFYKKIFDKKYAEIKQGDYYFTGLLYHDNQGDFIVLLSARDLYGTGKLENLRNILVIAFLISIIFISILGQYYAKQALSPISRIIKKVNNIRAESLNLRLDAFKGNDELADLTRTFNNMLDRLETSFEMKINFVHNASHELKNPLTAIIGQTEVALSNDRTQQQYVAALQTIEIEALRLNDLINALIKLAYADQDAQGLTIEMIRADELLMELKMGFDAQTSNNINFNFQSLPNDSNALVFKGNQSLIKVALLNIMDNALKYSNGSSIDLDVRTRQSTIEISVRDTGIGISEKDLKNVFEPFYRGSNAKKYKGFGFGLSLSDKIVRLHGGELKIHSELGKGTLVLVQLPNIDVGFKIAR